ncbi:hypothetical protein HUO13_24240 [Saccharopolyspora erythraea]|nr:hypothetical protein HUO13_24240 [Saccharopolyspora erythraea]
MGSGEYAAEVHEGDQTTEHRVLVPRELVDDLDVSAPDEKALVVESIRYLLERTPVTALPHDIDLDAVRREHGDFLPEVRARLDG